MVADWLLQLLNLMPGLSLLSRLKTNNINSPKKQNKDKFTPWTNEVLESSLLYAACMARNKAVQGKVSTEPGTQSLESVLQKSSPSALESEY